MGKSTSIPEPPGLPLLGNLFDIDMELPLNSLYELAEKHGMKTTNMELGMFADGFLSITGEIYRMRFPGHTFIIANNYAMVNEFCDERRFPKSIFALKV